MFINRRRDAAAPHTGAFWESVHAYKGEHGQNGRTAHAVRPSDPRRRTLDAFAWTVAHEGYESTDIEWVLALAEVPAPVFAEHFEDKRDCMLAVLDELLAEIGEAVRGRIDPAAEWCERVRTGLSALLDELARDPARARVVLVECLSSGEAAITRLHSALDGCVALLDEGLTEPSAVDVDLDTDTDSDLDAALDLNTDMDLDTDVDVDLDADADVDMDLDVGLDTDADLDADADLDGDVDVEDLPAHVSEAVAGGIASILHNRALDRRTAELPELLPELLYFALMPYLGHERASIVSRLG